MTRLLALVGLCLLAAACGSDAPAAPSPASVAGNWTGTFQSTQAASGASIVAFVMNLTQAGSSVSGTWGYSGLSIANGTVSGATTTSSFSGTFTFNATATNGTACTGTFAVSGNAGGNTLTWTSPGVTANCTNLPTGITIAVQAR